MSFQKRIFFSFVTHKHAKARDYHYTSTAALFAMISHLRVIAICNHTTFLFTIIREHYKVNINNTRHDSMIAWYSTELMQRHVKTLSMDSTASKDVRTHLCCLSWGNRLLPCKQLWKTRKSVLQAVLQYEGGQRAPSAMIWAVIVAGLEGTHGKVV